MTHYVPGYVKLYKQGKLLTRAKQLSRLFAPCRLCPWNCRVDRKKGETGRCGAGQSIRVSKATAHFGEEPAISGTAGSGTVFFSFCNLKCCFCQNYQISQQGLGAEVSVEELARKMLALQRAGCHNINLVSPTHYLPGIVTALNLAAGEGLLLPLVYNTNGYEAVGVLRLLEGIVDVYLPDAKYADDTMAMRYSSAQHYSAVNLPALQEMFRQVGYLLTDSRGIAQRGLLVRHLVLPGGLSGTRHILTNLKTLFGRLLSVSLMGQYAPCHEAHRVQELCSRTPRHEYEQAIEALEALGFENGWIQDVGLLDESYIPDFRKKDSWN